MRTRISPRISPRISTGLATAGGLILLASAALGVTLGAAHAKPAAKPARPTAAVSVERFSTPASYRAPARQGRGYSAISRHMADCLATYRHYDPDTDQVKVRPGVSRRCEL